MGSWFSSDEQIVEEKTVDMNGNVNNNIIIREAQATHLLLMNSERLLIATYLLVFLEIVKLSICFYQSIRRGMKKRYLQNRNNNGQNRNNNA